MPSFHEISDLAALDTLLASAGTSVLLLHDPWCPISERAWGELESSAAETIVWFDVSERRDFSALVASRTGVRHESPQLFVLIDGNVVWSGSHSRIRATTVNEALGSSAAR